MRCDTLDDVRKMVVIDPATRCWLWQGQTYLDKTPRVYAWHHNNKRYQSMTGTRAVWEICNNRAPYLGRVIFRSCGVKACLCPVHLREALNKREMFAHIKLSGRLVGNSTAQRISTVAIARAASGVIDTPPDIVRAIRAAPAEETNISVGRRFGVSNSAVSSIRRGRTRSSVV